MSKKQILLITKHSEKISLQIGIILNSKNFTLHENTL